MQIPVRPRIQADETELLRTDSAPQVLDNEELRLASLLQRVHGPLRVASEASGLHFYIACPQCLENEGEVELTKLHFAINIDRYRNGHGRACQCMKCNFRPSIVDLQFMPPLEDRDIARPLLNPIAPELTRSKYLMEDANGNWVPMSPGSVIPVRQLPEEHPARFYLQTRGYNVDVLDRQFHVAFCTKENPDLPTRRQPGGFRATPQGRIVFFAYQKGVCVGWQARILELDCEDGYKYFWHPYNEEWVPVMQVGHDQRYMLLPGFEGWDPAKYLTAYGAKRNQMLMGFDAAVEFNKPNTNTWCLLAEGPLDAGRFGPPAMALLGKSLSDGQIQLLRHAFEYVFLAPDTDAAGQKAAVNMRTKLLASGISFEEVELEPGCKDLGEASPEYVQNLFLNCTNKINNHE